jgi:hypothetical protein
MVEKTQPELVSDDDSDKFRESRRASAALPSIYVDTWFFSRFSGMFRISMGETFNKINNQYRFAFVLEEKEARRFAYAILDMLKEKVPAPEEGGTD